MRRRHLVLLSMGLLAACSSDDPPTTESPACIEAEDGRLTLVADDIAWDTSCLQAPAGELTIVVDNQDDGVNHNVHLPDAPGSPATDLVMGPSTTELVVSLDAGSYEYICDIHPNMVGTLEVTDTNP